MGAIEIIKTANKPGPPEDGIILRVASTLGVCIGIAACVAEGELSSFITLGSIIFIVLGNLFSYWRRRNPYPMLKLVLSFCVMGSFVWFFLQVSNRASAGNIASVEGPLAVLFTLIQVTHAFDVPARRDIGFSIAGSATLMAAAGAQAITDVFALYAVLWACATLCGLMAFWGSMAGGIQFRARTIGVLSIFVLLAGLFIVAVLPAPKANSAFVLPSSLANDFPLSAPDGLVGGATGSEPAKAAKSTGRTRVGGFLGFAGPLTTADRVGLANTVVFRVRADEPTFWIAQTYDHWSGTAWTTEPLTKHQKILGTQLNGSSPFALPISAMHLQSGTSDYQTFYLTVPGPNLIFHADTAVKLWFPAKSIYVGEGGTLRSSTTMGKGSIYTVESKVTRPTYTTLKTARPDSHDQTDEPVTERSDLELPYADPRVAALAKRVTEGDTTKIQKVLSLENWIGNHTKYTLTIPPLQKGQNTVDAFLFQTKRGYCEQISSSLTVLLRTLGIPAREAVGYVPGTYDPFTDLYQERASDAHSWVQVWFTQYGWQSFDPTADVPEANPTPGAIFGHDLADFAKKVPWTPTGSILGLLIVIGLAVRIYARRPKTLLAKGARQLGLVAKQHGLDVAKTEPLLALGKRIDKERSEDLGESSNTAESVAARLEEAAFGPRNFDRSELEHLIKTTHDLKK